MRYNTKKYSIEKYEDAWDEFGSDTVYEVNTKDGYCFDGGSHLEYARSYDELKMIIGDIMEEVI